MRGDPEVLEAGRPPGRQRGTTAVLGLLLAALAVSGVLHLQNAAHHPDEGVGPLAPASTTRPPTYRPDHGWTCRPPVTKGPSRRHVASVPRTPDAAAVWVERAQMRTRGPDRVAC
ncbi:MAG: hypothetical protein ACXV3S_11120 [Kineosporiaceae bacterium]